MSKRRRQKREYDFTLVLTDGAELTEKTIDALYEAGCDDATISSRSGRVILTFSREADCLIEAIMSAIGDVKSAAIGADVLRVDDCNLVTQAEIARKIGRSRQLVSQYIFGRRGPGKFPRPVGEISGKTQIWHWCEVAYWLRENNLIKEEVFREAESIAAINAVLEMAHQIRLCPQLMNEIQGNGAICSLWRGPAVFSG